MNFPHPNLDDRSFDELVASALDVVRRNSAGWTDLSVGDPGVALVEAFAHLTELMIYRINRLPEKAYIVLLELLGVRRLPPFAASAPLLFTLEKPLARDLYMPAGTQVSTARLEGSDPVTFETLLPGVLKAGEVALTVPAGHCVTHEAELCGLGTGVAGLRLRVARNPIVAPNLPGANLIVGVETAPKDIPQQAATVDHEGRAFVLWQEVDRFGAATRGRPAFVIDRLAGEIAFAPALRLPDEQGMLPAHAEPLGMVPPLGREIRVWYRAAAAGIGAVRAGLLTVLKPPIAGLSVVNPEPSTGGKSAESVENAIARGQAAFSTLERAITARDFENLARQASGGVNRARAVADVALWAHGVPGAVSLILVPDVEGTATPAALQAAASETVSSAVAAAVEERKPLGSTCIVNWARFRTVSVRADVRVHPGEDPEAMRLRLVDRLNRLITPIETGPDRPGWPFGRSLLDWDVLRAISDQPGVAAITNVRLAVDKAPDADVVALARDASQRDTWYAISGSDLYRSGNNGDSWEPLANFSEEVVVLVDAFRPEAGGARPGLVCALTRSGESTRLYLSRNCGDSFTMISLMQIEITAVAWVPRGAGVSLFLASPTGLYEIALIPDAAPRQVLFDNDQPELGATSVAVSSDGQGRVIVAVGGSGESGVYLSTDAGRAGSFVHSGLRRELVRVLMVQHTPTQRWLWAGTSAAGTEAGTGAFRLRLEAEGGDVDGWLGFSTNWVAGSCRALAHDGRTIYAGSLRRGVLCLDPDDKKPAWRIPDVSCGLPLRDVSRLQPVNTLAAAPGLLLVGGPKGIHRSIDSGLNYVGCSASEQETELKLPASWVFCSGGHRLRVTR